MRFKLALRNIFRNRGRSLVSVLMIAGAVAGIITFRGFENYILAKMRQVTTSAEYGHIQIATRQKWNSDPGKISTHYIHHPKLLENKLASIPKIKSISGRLSTYCLISSGNITVSAKMMGFQPGKEPQVQSQMKMLSGHKLNAKSKMDAIVGAGLARRLHIKLGDTVTAVGYTLDNEVNAMDFTTVGIYSTRMASIDNNVFFVPLTAAQTMLNTQAIGKLTLRLFNVNETNAVRDQIMPVIQKINPNFVAKTWYEQADFYRQVVAFYDMQNSVIVTILITLVLLGILNAVGMSVYERTGEIGTCRALGDTSRDVRIQFLLEGLILAGFGIVIGSIFGFVISWSVEIAKVKVNMPASTGPMPIQINMITSAFVQAGIVGLFATILASWFPARRASRLPIVEALRKNI